MIIATYDTSRRTGSPFLSQVTTPTMVRPTWLVIICTLIVSLSLLGQGHIAPFGNDYALASFQNIGVPVTNIYVDDAITAAKVYVEHTWGLSACDYQLQHYYRTPELELTSFYFVILHQGHTVANRFISLHVHDNHTIVAASITPVGQPLYPAPQAPVKTKCSPKRALRTVLAHFRNQGLDTMAQHTLPNQWVVIRNPEQPGVYEISPVSLASDGKVRAEEQYISDPQGHLHRVWALNFRRDPQWLTVYIDQTRMEVRAILDWMSAACYRVFPWPVGDPGSEKRSLECNPWANTLPNRPWHRINDTTFYDTQGNNVRSETIFQEANHHNRTVFRPMDGTALVFDFPFDPKQEPFTYVNASITNLFYHCNKMHDLFYIYGFNEEAGNFQMYNFGKGGREGDALIAYSQLHTEVNNAYFRTPPDGYSPTMWMFLWTYTTPARDGSLDGSAITHEYTHGLTARLTGGPLNTYCLILGESAGLGEGWSDWVAIILQVKPYHTRQVSFPMAPYLADKVDGLRKHRYSVQFDVNPTTYGWLNRRDYQEPHNMGEIWANVLYEVFWNLVDKHGFQHDWFSGNTTYGNILALQLVIDGLKLQPCFPDFLAARDAIILADQLRTSGVNRCIIWRAFSKRGLGTSANLTAGTHHEDFSFPADCSAK
ncbi:hypothetical protein IWQ62_005849 [Dispira parvispora]|uniref:Extracellular metalloproteinase n=1 Tax=Dispira parvispora TaxID=1520584 RepID=A0A9W8ALG3_9FUNG|nr:hypothetical protein IWQ62_005849 [Dispira parvispora]